nr:M3 family metallopeptidase [uncultured Methanoregula sp.]
MKKHPYLYATCAALLLTAAAFAGCLQHQASPPPAGPLPESPVNATAPIRAHYSPGEIPRLSLEAEAAANTSLNAIAALPPEQRTMDTTLLAFDTAMTDYSDAISPLCLMGYVSTDPQVASEGMAAVQSSSVFSTSAYSRRDLYEAIRGQVPRTPEETRLFNNTILAFRQHGLDLPDEQLARVTQMKKNLSQLETRYSANLQNDNTTLAFTAGELEGVPAASLSAFTREPGGKYRVTMSSPDYTSVMTFARSDGTRKKMYAAYMSLQSDSNTPLLQEAIGLRRSIARELGYATWADYRLDGRVAKNVQGVNNFLDALKAPVKENYRMEIADLLLIKQGLQPGATGVDPWDVLYLQEVRNRQRYGYSEEEVREYLPYDTVLQGMFTTFGKVFSIRFDEVKDAPVWADGVQVFRVGNLSDNATLGYLYIDPFPREGKYGYFCTYPVINGRMKNGTYAVPVVAIIGNFHAPAGDKPALLTPVDGETLFHETGHSLHHLLTRVPYGTQSGMQVAWDFAETPSLAMENWWWDPQVMESVSGDYTNASRKMPASLRDKIIASRDAVLANYYSIRLVYALEDMEFHSSDHKVNMSQVWEKNYEEVTGLSALAGTDQPASFSYLMEGYDAGMYSYLWARVYAVNAGNVFRHDGMTNQTTGLRYRKTILEKGNMEDGDKLIRDFLGTEPTTEVLYRQLGVNMTGQSGNRR